MPHHQALPRHILRNRLRRSGTQRWHHPRTPFGLSNDAAAYASAHVEPSGRHQRFALDLFATTSTHTHADSSEEDEAWVGADFSGLRDPQAMRLFLAASDYYFGYFDSNNEGAYNPTRECFHIGLRIESSSFVLVN